MIMPFINQATLVLVFAVAALGQELAWSQLGADIDGEAAGDISGEVVSLSSDGTVLAIAGPLSDGAGNDAGHVRTYSWSGSAWEQLGDDIDGEAAGDQSGFGMSLSRDGSVLAIGANGNSGAGTASGHVRVYEWSGSAWSKLGADINGEAPYDNSGFAVSLSSDGMVVAVSAVFNDGSGAESGHVRVYRFSNGTWTQLGADIDGEAASDRSGWSVALSSDGMILAVGAIDNDGQAGSNSGHVRVYSFNSSAWIQLGGDIDGEAEGTNSGHVVALSSDGKTVAIGAPSNAGSGTRAGHVRVFSFTAGNWVQLGADIDGEAAGDNFGWSVSLSSDGTALAVGATENGGLVFYKGYARVYLFRSGQWMQMGPDIVGEESSDWFGRSVSLSSNGSVVAIGAPQNDGEGGSSGHARVYTLTQIENPDPEFDIVMLLAFVLVACIAFLCFALFHALQKGEGSCIAAGEVLGPYTDDLEASDSGHRGFDAFLSHDWGEDELGRNNHTRVTKINTALQLFGIQTWFDSNRLKGGDISQVLADAVERSRVVVVFVTKAYMNKVKGDNFCSSEFTFAKTRHGKLKMIPVVMEPAMTDQKNWSGPLGLHLGGALYEDMSTDAKVEENVPRLAERIAATMALET